MGLRVLIVDDSGTMRALIQKALLGMGIRENDMVQCESGDKVLPILTCTAIDAVILDWHMPQMNGLEVLRAVKASPFAHIPVIMLTTESKKKNVEAAVRAGAYGYMIKPLNAEKLRDKISKIRAAAFQRKKEAEIMGQSRSEPRANDSTREILVIPDDPKELLAMAEAAVGDTGETDVDLALDEELTRAIQEEADET